MNVPSSTSGHAAFFAMRDAAAQRMAPTGAARTPIGSPRSGQIASADNISLTKPARPVDPLLATQSAFGPIKGGRIDFIA